MPCQLLAIYSERGERHNVSLTASASAGFFGGAHARFGAALLSAAGFASAASTFLGGAHTFLGAALLVPAGSVASATFLGAQAARVGAASLPASAVAGLACGEQR